MPPLEDVRSIIFTFKPERQKMKICHICWCNIPKTHYTFRTKSSRSIVACATCRLLFERSVRKNENDFCQHGAVLIENCSGCHFYKCTSMGMSKLRIFKGKIILIFWVIFKRRLIFLGTAKKNTQRAAKQYFRYTLPTKIIESICDKHPDIIKDTQVILNDLSHRWTSKQTLFSLTLFKKISILWIQELLKDPLVIRLVSSAQVKMANVIYLNQEYIYFLMLANFFVPEEIEEQVVSLVAYPFIDGKFTQIGFAGQ